MDGIMSGIVKNQVEGKMKNASKQANFKSLYTWARVAGFVCSLIVLGMVFNNQFIEAPGCAALAIAGSCFCLFCEVICCFKCCNGTKACATKIDKVLSYGPFFKGTVYMVFAVVGFIAYNFEVAEPGYTHIDVVMDFVLLAVPGIMYFLAFIVTDRCKLRQPKGSKGKSDIEEQFPTDPDAAVGPHRYQKKNVFSKTCKECGAKDGQECAERQEAAAAAAAAAAEKATNNPFNKMKGGFKDLGSRMSNGFKELGAKMKVGTPTNKGGSSPNSGTSSPARNSNNSSNNHNNNSARNSFRSATSAKSEPVEEEPDDNPFSKKNRKPKPKTTVKSRDDENPFL